ncbi:thioesterase [Amylibacter sp. SFDW26]|uniref:thioesterase family protein n=1 Tax=Amylibacter sp. SFDW26 TaxID=2652722 RepID=UPI001261E797|nr:thioesterase family protein [Amylibacter sp. SFDW26]KAB7614682.1 thioesterase [Amylibacter sp. SFDW26]
MFPFIRLGKELIKFSSARPITLDETHVSTHICWPIDIDFYGELNNGRTLSLYDLGRIAMGQRVGLLKALRTHKWGLTMAGASVRYRRRITTFQKFTMKTRPVGRDERFLYIEQSMWSKGEATSSILYRSAVTDKNGIVPTQRVAEALGHPDWNPEMPEWVQNWIKAEDTRVWPPGT